MWIIIGFAVFAAAVCVMAFRRSTSFGNGREQGVVDDRREDGEEQHRRSVT